MIACDDRNLRLESDQDKSAAILIAQTVKVLF